MDQPCYFDTSPARSFGFRLWHVRQAFTRRVDAVLAPMGVTHMQYVMLRAADYLAGAGEQPTQARLAEVTAADRMMVSKVLRLLESKGLVVRPAHPTDARAHHVVLTASGLRLVERAVPAVMQVQDRFFGRLGQERVEHLGAILDELLRLEGNPIVSKHIVSVATDDTPGLAGAGSLPIGAIVGAGCAATEERA